MTEKGQRLAKPGEQVKGFYARSTQARVIHVDGAFGGVTNPLLVHMAIYSEHHAPADEIILTQQAGGGILESSPEQGDKVSFVREIEADLMMTPSVARALRDWLTDRLADVEASVEQIRSAQQGQ